MERKAWHCPGCGKVHAPHVDTCPETLGVVTVPSMWPAEPVRDTTGYVLNPPMPKGWISNNIAGQFVRDEKGNVQ